MNRSRLSLVVLAAAIAVSVLGAGCSSSGGTESADDIDGGGVDAAEIAPIFSVATTEGGQFSLSDHLATDGRPVFLNLWASWCFPCREEMPAIDAASRTHDDVAFIGVAVQDTPGDAAAFAEEIGVTYLLAVDEDGSVEDAYSPLGLPASYLISAEGVIVERIFGKVTEEDLAEKFAKHFG